MQTANIILALGEDPNNTVPKRGVTPAEVAVLMAIHGENAVSDIAVQDDTDISGREHYHDLARKYGRATDGENQPIIRRVFPTPTSPMPTKFADLMLPPELFKTGAPKTQTPAKEPESVEKSIDDMTKAELVAYAKTNDIEIDASAKKSEILAAIEAAEEDEPESEDDEQGAGENALG